MAQTIYRQITELRKLAKDDCEKDLFKLMNNVVFGRKKRKIENIEILN